MPDITLLILLYAVGLVMLLAEIFIPSHGVLTVAGLGFLFAAVAKTFSYAGREAGIVAIFACLVFLPVFAYLSVKYWPHTPIGRRIAPPNPVLDEEDPSTPAIKLGKLVGETGRAVSPLRPSGICVFNGRRITCVAEHGIIEADCEVEAIGIRNGNLAVRAKTNV